MSAMPRITIFNRRSNKTPVAFPRIERQEGYFSLHSNPNEELPLDGDNTFEVPAFAKHYFLGKLQNYGINVSIECMGIALGMLTAGAVKAFVTGTKKCVEVAGGCRGGLKLY